MNLPDLNTIGALGLGAGVAALAAGWQQVKGLLSRILGIAVVTVEMTHYAADVTQVWIGKSATRRPGRFTARPFLYYFGFAQFIRSRSAVGAVMYEKLGERGRLVWYQGWPVWASVKNHKDDSSVRATTAASDKTVLRFIRGTIDPDRMLFDIANTTNVLEDQSVRRFAVYRRSGRSTKDIVMSAQGAPVPSGNSNAVVAGRLVGWKKDDVGEDTSVKDPVGRMSLDEETEAVVNRIRRWYKAKDWYTKRRIPWRLGCLFFGIPGTGKSSLVKAIAQELNIPIYVIDISTMDNQEFHYAYREALTNTPSVILIEDIDAVFHGRENVAAERGKGLTFDCLLNTISGVESTDGALLIVTTNNIDLIDPALGISRGSRSTRPGRIDCVVELPVLDSVGREKMARRILEGCSYGLVELAVAEGENDTGAQFEDRCATMALDDFWSKHGQT